MIYATQIQTYLTFNTAPCGRENAALSSEWLLLRQTPENLMVFILWKDISLYF